MPDKKKLKQAPPIIQYLVLVVAVLIVVFIAHSWTVGKWFEMGMGVFLGIGLVFQIYLYANKLDKNK